MRTYSSVGTQGEPESPGASHPPKTQPSKPVPTGTLGGAAASASDVMQAEGPNTDETASEKTQMQESLRRSITLVFWYKANVDPIRLNHTISTFPLFQLSHFPALIADLKLTPTSCVDAYNPHTGHWEQHMVTTVRTVESEQVLLYRTRRSLIDGLGEDECVGLREELLFQPRVHSRVKADTGTMSAKNSPLARGRSLKRLAPDSSPEPGPERKHQVTESYLNRGGYVDHTSAPSTSTYLTASGSHELASSSIPTPQTPSSAHATPTFVQSPPATSSRYHTPHPSSSKAPANSSASSIPYHPHPPLKRWPNDYTVQEISAGFRAMDALVAAGSPGPGPPATQRSGFERIFGCRYVKSTVCRHRGVWKRADASIREAFEAMGSDERAMWGEFVRKVEGRPPGKMGSSSVGTSATSATSAPANSYFHDPGPPIVKTPRTEDEEDGDEAVTPTKPQMRLGVARFASITDSDAPPPTDQSDPTTVYDPALTTGSTK